MKNSKINLIYLILVLSIFIVGCSSNNSSIKFGIDERTDDTRYLSKTSIQEMKDTCNIELNKLKTINLSHVYITGFIDENKRFYPDNRKLYYNVNKLDLTSTQDLYKNARFNINGLGCRYGEHEGEDINLIYCVYEIKSPEIINQAGVIIRDVDWARLKLFFTKLNYSDNITIYNDNYKFFAVNIKIDKIDCLVGYHDSY